jgi:hyaluronan synthase
MALSNGTAVDQLRSGRRGPFRSAIADSPTARRVVSLPVHLTLSRNATGGETIAGRVFEVDESSCRLATRCKLQDGDVVTLRFDRYAKDARRHRLQLRWDKPVVGTVRIRCEGQEKFTEARGEGDAQQFNECAVLFRSALRMGRVWTSVFLSACGITAFAGATLGILLLKSHNVHYFSGRAIPNAYSLAVGFFVLSRFVLAALYRVPTSGNTCPSVTVVIAAKDEEQSIGRTLDYIFESDYPRDKFEVIAVDDGSSDQTGAEMDKVRIRHPGLRVVRFPVNLGKRRAMDAGIRLASGEILVFVDSDTFLRPDAIRKLVRGFADESVGAVCGHAFVENAEESWLTRMQEVRYYVSFRVLKAAESLFGTVTCCSGCLSAYRRSAVLEVVDEWLNQRFLGVEATFGDDRSLTNHLLRKHRILYDCEAVCTTIAPAENRKFFRQQLRWKKSWLRESLVASGFLWRRHPVAAVFFYLQVIISLTSPFCVLAMLMLPLLGVGEFSPIYALGVALVACLYGFVYLVRFSSGMWIHGILFQVIYSVALAWMNYYAIFTLRRNHWGTR